jgi:hypothetical protein
MGRRNKEMAAKVKTGQPMEKKTRKYKKKKKINYFNLNLLDK